MLPSVKRGMAGIAALAALALGGSAIASAASSTTSTTPSTGAATPTAPNGQSPASFPAHGTAAHEDAEKTLTGQAAAKAQAAAVKSVGSGTAGPVTSDFTGNGYEVTVTKSDGTKVEVHLDTSFNVMQGHDGHGDHGGAPAGYGG